MSQLISSLESSGLGALELFCLGLKAEGTYLSRALSYKAAEFEFERMVLSYQHRVMYDRITQFWQVRPVTCWQPANTAYKCVYLRDLHKISMAVCAV